VQAEGWEAMENSVIQGRCSGPDCTERISSMGVRDIGRPRGKNASIHMETVMDLSLFFWKLF
jgi:hypothetical protein